MQKVILKYTPEGGSPRSWEIDLEDPAWDIRFQTEKSTGWAWAVFAEKLSEASAVALQALIWTLRKRDEPRLSIDAVMPMLSEVDFEEVEPPQAPPPSEGEDPKA